MAFMAALPAIAGAVAGAGAQVGGGLLDFFLNQKQVYDQMKQQRDFAQNSIQWRVKDAAKAGIHPLYALGAQPTQSFPVMMESHIGEGIAGAGDRLADVIRRQFPEQNEKDQFERRIMAATAEKAEVEVDLARNELRRQAAQPIPSLAVNPDTVSAENPYFFHPDNQSSLNDAMVNGGKEVTGVDIKPGDYELKKGEVKNPSSFAEERIAGAAEPVMKEYTLAPGLHIQMPDLAGESFEETMDSISAPAYIGLLLRNREIYGDSWLEKFLKFRFGGQIPKGREKFDPRHKHQAESFHPKLREGR